ncbi:tripartite tricarboxylate transporter TctB family protein [Streptomyces sp. NPDC050211]|uniref:tripartite tricarboxylate transporter TctB family protein n=1 Tax=Streptomyces sp. NPDC050211 TaxID=3154932 RepID=UPI00341CB804
MRTQARLGALVPLGIGALAALAAVSMGLGSPADPGPGLWPLIVSLTMVTLSASLLLNPGADTEQEPFSRQTAVVALGALSLVAYTLLIERVGFEVMTVLLLVLWMRGFGRDSWRLSLAVAVAACAASYLLFIVALGVSLPRLVAF